MNALLGNSPVLSQVWNVRRHSLACGDLRLKAPLVASSMKPRSWSLDKGALCRPACNVASLGSPTNG